MALRDLRGWSSKQAAPATIALIALMIVTSVYWWYTHLQGSEGFMLTHQWTSQPWQLLTYPFAFNPLSDGLSFMFFVCVIAWMIFAGTTLERELGTARFVALWVVTTIAPALLVGIYAAARGIEFRFGGPFLPVEGITIAWCTRYATNNVMLYGFVPMSGKWLAWLTVAMVFFLYGAIRPEFGVLASIPLVLPWLYATNRIPNLAWGRYGGKTNLQQAKKTERMDKKYYDDVKRREQDRAERERLRKLFESSLDDDHKDR